MRFFAVLALAAAVSAASLQRRQSFPNCSESCLSNADFGSCDPLDDSCLCHDSGFVTSVTDCITSACSGTDLANAEAAAQQLCLAVGVTLTATSTSSGSASATGSAAGSATATSPSGSGSTSTSAATSTATGGSNSAASHGVNALVALAAVGAVALAL